MECEGNTVWSSAVPIEGKGDAAWSSAVPIECEGDSVVNCGAKTQDEASPI